MLLIDRLAPRLAPVSCRGTSVTVIWSARLLLVGSGRRRFSGRGGGRARPPQGDPAVDVPLDPARDAERSRRHIVDDHTAGRGVGAVADLDRCNEHVVSTGPGMRPDHGVMFPYPVIVDGNRCGANVRMLTDRRITDIRKVRNLRALTDLGVLRL